MRAYPRSLRNRRTRRFWKFIGDPYLLEVARYCRDNDLDFITLEDYSRLVSAGMQPDEGRAGRE